MSVHRGSVTKRGDKIHLKTSYPSPTPLPVQACKKVHVSVLSPCASQKPENVWLTSCASEMLLLEPAGTVLGELTGEVKETSTRLHVQLSPLSAQSLERLSAKQLPSAPAAAAAAQHADESDLASRVSNAENNAHASMAMTFNDRCFTKMKLASEVKRFLMDCALSMSVQGSRFTRMAMCNCRGSATSMMTSWIECRLSSWDCLSFQTCGASAFQVLSTASLPL